MMRMPGAKGMPLGPPQTRMPESFARAMGKGTSGLSRGFSSGGFGKGLGPMVPGPPPPLQGFEVDRENTFLERLWGLFSEDEREVPDYGPPAMVPIPWQRKEEHVSNVAEPHSGFDYMEVEDLQAMATSRELVIKHLEEEIEGLERDDAKHEERLATLERQFGNLVQGDTVKVKAPLLAKISAAVRDSHLLDHEEELNQLGNPEEQEEKWWNHLHAQNLTMGRGYMPLDRKFIAKERFKEELERDKHPVVNRVHHAGHIANPAHQVESVFVKEGGILKRHAVHPTPYRNKFWLSLDGPAIEDQHAIREAQQKAMEDPVLQRIVRQDVAGEGVDAKPEDWLGRLKKGEMINESPPHDPGFVMPKWMY